MRKLRFVPKVRISLPVVIQVRSRIHATSSFTGHEYDFTLSYSVDKNKRCNIKKKAHLMK